MEGIKKLTKAKFKKEQPKYKTILDDYKIRFKNKVKQFKH